MFVVVIGFRRNWVCREEEGTYMYTAVCLIGTDAIICQAPMLYVQRSPLYIEQDVIEFPSNFSHILKA